VFPLVEVDSRAPRERGRQYGEQVRDEISVSVEFYRREFELRSALSWYEVRRRVPEWVPAIEAYHPDALDEVRGIAEGSRFSFEEILALNARGELRAGNPFEVDECTSFALTQAATGDGHVYCGQTWDWRVGTQESVVIVRIRQEPKPTVVMQVEAGQVGRHGASSAGIGLNANGLGIQPGPLIGVPVCFVRRRILDSSSFEDALRSVSTSRQTACSNLLVTERGGGCQDIELTPHGHAVIHAAGGSLVHANAFLAYDPPPVDEAHRPSAEASHRRVARVEECLDGVRAVRSTADARAVIARALSDHVGYPKSVCRHPESDEAGDVKTVAASIVDLTTGEYLISAGNPCEHRFEPLPWHLYE
jgi:isopenicillin-N N-acyltransferase-like protein